MVQVVTNENIQQLIQTRAVPEFKAPEAKTEAAPAAAAEPSKEGSAPATDTSKDAPRDLTTGKFVKADGEKEQKTDTAAKAADDDDSDDDGAKLSDAVKRKIDKIVAKKHRAMKEAEEFGRDEYNSRRAAEQRAEALQREIDALKGAKSGTGPAPDKASEGKPKPEDFKTVGEYTDALVEWRFNQRVKTQEAQDSQRQQKQQFEQVQNQMAERVAAFAKTVPDYSEVLEAADREVPPHIEAYFYNSEYPGELGYYLAKHPDELDRIARLSPTRALGELGKLETKFEKQPEPAKSAAAATPSVSRAPAPITPLEGKTTPVEKDPAKMSFQELRAYRMAERAAGKR